MFLIKKIFGAIFNMFYSAIKYLLFITYMTISRIIWFIYNVLFIFLMWLSEFYAFAIVVLVVKLIIYYLLNRNNPYVASVLWNKSQGLLKFIVPAIAFNIIMPFVDYFLCNICSKLDARMKNSDYITKDSEIITKEEKLRQIQIEENRAKSQKEKEAKIKAIIDSDLLESKEFSEKNKMYALADKALRERLSHS